MRARLLKTAGVDLPQRSWSRTCLKRSFPTSWTRMPRTRVPGSAGVGCARCVSSLTVVPVQLAKTCSSLEEQVAASRLVWFAGVLTWPSRTLMILTQKRRRKFLVHRTSLTSQSNERSST
uniref:Uncharacterized protein n=1 Tax=Timema cristinae TaxID=61476 RepID=A0A7R9HF73_TIMCR|nr:unnamed protein product [Timema cristinae]